MPNNSSSTNAHIKHVPPSNFDLSQCPVGVVIPVYNRPRNILQTLDSILCQTLPPKQLVIANDGSTDRTAQSIQAWIEEHTGAPFETRLLNLPNGGVSFARNQGFAQLHNCQAVLFLDSDDTLQDNFLATTVATLISAPNAVAVSAMARLDLINDWGLEKYILYCGGELASNTLFRYSTFDTDRMFDEALLTGQDSDLFIRIQDRHEWLCVDKSSVDRGAGEKFNECGRLNASLFAPSARWAMICEQLITSLNTRKRMSARRSAYFHETICLHWVKSIEDFVLNRQNYFSTIPKITMYSLQLRYLKEFLQHKILHRYFRHIAPMLSRLMNKLRLRTSL